MPTLLSVSFILVLLLQSQSPHDNFIVNVNSTTTTTTVVGAAMEPLAKERRGHGRYTRLKSRKGRVFDAREAEGCLPKGFWLPPSSPSPYGNYYTLGSAMCSPKGHRKPWNVLRGVVIMMTIKCTDPRVRIYRICASVLVVLYVGYIHVFPIKEIFLYEYTSRICK